MSSKCSNKTIFIDSIIKAVRSTLSYRTFFERLSALRKHGALVFSVYFVVQFLYPNENNFVANQGRLLAVIGY